MNSWACSTFLGFLGFLGFRPASSAKRERMPVLPRRYNPMSDPRLTRTNEAAARSTGVYMGEDEHQQLAAEALIP